MQTGTAARPRLSVAHLLFASALLMGLAIRLHNFAADGLWLDELWGATFAQLSLKDTIIAVIRFDVHPPLYYLQLDLWGELFGRSDRTLLMNAVFWSGCTLVAVYVAASRLVTASTAVAGAVATALSGGEVYYAQELRMYGMMAFLAVLAWHACARYVEAPNHRRLAALVLVSAMLAASHGASIVPVSSIVVFLVLQSGFRDVVRPHVVLPALLTAASVLPVVATSMLRGVSHVPVLSPAEVTGTLGGWLFGFRYPLSPFQTASACGVVAVAIGVSLISGRNVRNMVLAFVVWPLAFAAAVSLFVRPIWIPRVFEFCVPFVCIAIGHAFAACWKHFAGRGRLAVLSVGAMLALSMATAAWEQAEKGRKMEYREAAAFLSAHAAPGDVIYAPDFPTFWGLARYMAGPAWGSPLTIQDPVRPTPEPTVWDKLYAWLGPDWLARLDLVPGARTLGVKGAKLVVGWTPDQEVKAASRVWVVGSHDTSLAQLSMCRMASDVRIAFRGIQVFEVSCKPGMS